MNKKNENKNEREDLQVDKVGDYLDEKKITFCVTGGIAAIETPKLARMLRRYGAEVQAIMTENAEDLIIKPDALFWATEKPVVTKLSGRAEHIALEDLVLVAPATLNTINKIACGIADNAATSCIASAFGRGTPIVLVPAMHSSLYNNPIFQKNLKELARYDNIKIIPPRISEGKSKIADINTIAAIVARELSSHKLKGKNVLINAGPTRAYIDAVRYISNQSSGKLGISIADDFFKRGANVKLVYGPGTEKVPEYIDVITVETYQQMHDTMMLEIKNKEYNIAVFCAAVLDFEPEKYLDEKTKSDKEWIVKLIPTKKIIKDVDSLGKRLFKVGFKLEYNKTKDELIEIGHKSLIKNNADLVVANDLSEIDGEKHKAYIITPEKGIIEVNSKKGIVAVLADELGRRSSATKQLNR